MSSIDIDNETLLDLAGSRSGAMIDIGGWCSGCGRRRGRDGRCPNCDPWWSNALIQVGGPLIIGTLLLLFLGIRMLGPENRVATDTPSAPLSVGPHTAWAASRSVAALAASVPASPAAPSVSYSAAFSASPQPSAEAMQWAHLEHLRFLSHRTDEVLMQQQQTSTGQGYPRRSNRPALSAVMDSSALAEGQSGSF